jgi:polysaccharide export outer membrane protein
LQEVAPTQQVEKIAEKTQIRVQADDILNITIYGINPETVKPFNTMSLEGGNAQILQNPQTMDLVFGYLVDKEGFVDLPIIGRMEVMNLTITQVKAKIVDVLKKYLTEPVVNVRLLNFRVTVIGEVLKPGLVRLTNERLTLLEAIGQAGDLTLYANRTNILIIREKDGQRLLGRVNLQKKDFFNSPFFYLQQNDVVYVEPIREKVTTGSDWATRSLPFISTGISVISLIVLIATRAN